MDIHVINNFCFVFKRQIALIDIFSSLLLFDTFSILCVIELNRNNKEKTIKFCVCVCYRKSNWFVHVCVCVLNSFFDFFLFEWKLLPSSLDVIDEWNNKEKHPNKTSVFALWNTIHLFIFTRKNNDENENERII